MVGGREARKSKTPALVHPKALDHILELVDFQPPTALDLSPTIVDPSTPLDLVLPPSTPRGRSWLSHHQMHLVGWPHSDCLTQVMTLLLPSILLLHTSLTLTYLFSWH